MHAQTARIDSFRTFFTPYEMYYALKIEHFTPCILCSEIGHSVETSIQNMVQYFPLPTAEAHSTWGHMLHAIRLTVVVVSAGKAEMSSQIMDRHYPSSS